MPDVVVAEVQISELAEPLEILDILYHIVTQIQSLKVWQKLL